MNVGQDKQRDRKPPMEALHLKNGVDEKFGERVDETGQDRTITRSFISIPRSYIIEAIPHSYTTRSYTSELHLEVIQLDEKFNEDAKGPTVNFWPFLAKL